MPYALAAASSGPVFSHAHIAVTAAVTGLLTLAGARWRLPRRAWTDVAAITVLSAASVYLWPAARTPRRPGRAVHITARIERRQVLSGLINEYRRAASK